MCPASVSQLGSKAEPPACATPRMTPPAQTLDALVARLGAPPHLDFAPFSHICVNDGDRFHAHFPVLKHAHVLRAQVGKGQVAESDAGFRGR
jgi:hypothetical protein